MPRIAILHPDLGIGGAERLIVDIALALKSQAHQVDIYTNFHDPKRCFDETRNGQLNVFVACSWFPRHFFGRFNALCAYIRFILLAFYVVYIESRKGSYDLFVCDQISACIPMLKQSDRPVLFYCHFPDHLLTKRDSFLKKAYRWPIDAFERWTTCLADRVLVNSGFTKSEFQKHISSSFPVEIVYPTIPDRSLPLTSKKKKDTINFLSINRFERKKNLALAIQAFARLRELIRSDSSKVHLFVIGGFDPRLRENVEYFNELENLSKQLNLNSDSITFVRSFSDEEKVEFLSKADCILYTPSFEHFGIVPLEAMQAARPVIGTATGGPLETIVDGQTGFLCDEPLVENFSDRMKRFVDDPNLSKRLGDQGRIHVEKNFAFRPFSDKLNEHVKFLLDKPNETKRNFSLFFCLFVLLVSLLLGFVFF